MSDDFFSVEDLDTVEEVAEELEEDFFDTWSDAWHANMYAECQLLMDRIKPHVPKKTGFLRDSGFVSPRGATTRLGFRAEYALARHEQEGPGNHYLLIPFRSYAQEVVSRAAANMEGSMQDKLKPANVTSRYPKTSAIKRKPKRAGDARGRVSRGMRRT